MQSLDIFIKKNIFLNYMRYTSCGSSIIADLLPFVSCTVAHCTFIFFSGLINGIPNGLSNTRESWKCGNILLSRKMRSVFLCFDDSDHINLYMESH